MPIEWREKMSIGDATIDQDHHALIRLINQYEEAIAQHDARLLRHTFEGLCDYARAHFKREEKLMETVYFPERNAHGEIHKEFLRRVTDFHFQLLGGEKLPIAQASQFLHDWFVDHVLNEDLKLRDYILNHRRH